MRGRNLSRTSRIIIAPLLAIIVATGVFGSVFFAPQAALAQFPGVAGINPVGDPAAVTTAGAGTVTAGSEVKQTAWDVLKISLTNTAELAILNGVNYFAQKIAYDAANYVASGGNGQKPFFHTDGVGDYLASTAKDAAADVFGELSKDPNLVKFGINLCTPTDPRAALNIKLGFLNGLPGLLGGPPSAGAPKPVCSWDTFSTNWTQFKGLDSDTVLKNVGVMFQPGQSSLGAAIQVNNAAITLISKKQEAAITEFVSNNGFLNKVSKIGGKVQTPAESIKEQQKLSMEKAGKQSDQTVAISGAAFGNAAFGILPAALHTFTNTLAEAMMKKVFERGLITLADILGSGDSGADQTLSFDSAPPLGGKTAAELSNASLLTPKILAITNYNALTDFASCPSGVPRNPGNCVMDNQFFTAVSRASQGAAVTVRQAISQGLLTGNWPLIPLAHHKNLESTCFSEGYCYSNLVKLRKASILPVGWEMAANSPFNDVSRPVTLSEAMGRFNDCPRNTDGSIDDTKLPDPLHPWCHLIDPEWVLKYPSEICRQQAPGPTLLSSESPARSLTCVDETTCIAQDSSGNCIGGYGYCVREKNVWNMDADACPAYAASCTTFHRADGAPASYLSNTLDSGPCNSQNAGCRQYSQSRNAVPNPGFEDVMDGTPRDWTLSSGARFSRSGLLAQHGIDSVGVLSGANGGASVPVYSLQPGEEYTLSAGVLQESDPSAPGLAGSLKLSLFKWDGTPVASNPPLQTTCTYHTGDRFVTLTIASTHLGYLSGACKVSMPADVAYGRIDLSSNAVSAGGRTWFDDLGLFGASYSASPYDSLLMNGKIQKCASDQAGCTDFVRMSSGSLNLLRDPSFEFAAPAGGPSFWKLPTASMYEKGTLKGFDGVSAVRLDAAGASQDIPGILASASYDFSVFSRVDGTTSGSPRADIQLFDTAGQPTAPISSEGCDVPSAGTVLRMNLAAGQDYERSVCGFTTPKDVAFARVTLLAAAGGETLADAAQLELAVLPSSYHENYTGGVQHVFLKAAPEGLNCNGADRSPECENFAPSCRRDEVGCNSYDPVDGGTSIPAVTVDSDACPTECVGYDTFREEPSNFNAPRFPLFLVPSTADRCAASEAGCSEFTNVQKLASGGESREYFSYLRLCAKPDDNAGTYYTWEGNDTRGFQLRTWPLLKSNLTIAAAAANDSDPTGGNAPCTKLAYDVAGRPVCADTVASMAAAACFKYSLLTDPDCREFYDVDGNIHYRLYSKTVVINDACTEYRITDSTAAECDDHGGFRKNGECHYFTFAPESRSCRADAARCRAYSGNASRNVRVALTNDFETATTDGWTAAPGGPATTDVENSNESVTAGGHSLKVSRTKVSKDVSSTIIQGKSYVLNFWAKGSGDLAIAFSAAGDRAFTSNRLTGQALPLALGTEWRPYQVGPVTAVKAPVSGSDAALNEQLAFTLSGASTNLFFLDNVELREITDNLYLIRDSWETPDSCDQTPAGDPSPQYMLGCRAYKDRLNQSVALKSFDKICRPEAVGCEAMYDTHHTISPFPQTFSAICPLGSACVPTPGSVTCACKVAGQTVCQVIKDATTCRYDADEEVPGASVSASGDTVRIPADGVTYIVNDAQFNCDQANVGCTAMGDKTMDRERTAVKSWATTYLKNDPASYANTLCMKTEEYCQAYTRDKDKSSAYFKDPELRTCEYKEAITGYSGWFKTGTSEPCYGDFLSAGTQYGIWRNSDSAYEAWVGLCQPTYDQCKEFVDTRDTSPVHPGGTPYYAIKNDRLDSTTCQNRVSLTMSPSGANSASACVLFWQTDNLVKTFDASSTYEASDAANGGLVTAVSDAGNDSNIVIKVARDRQCGQWLDCRSSETVFNQSAGEFQNVCTSFGLCAEYERGGNGTKCVRYVESEYTGKTLTPKLYQMRDTGWKGLEYTSYSIPNQYPVNELVTINVSSDINKPDLRLVRTNGTCTGIYGSACGPTGDRGTCLGACGTPTGSHNACPTGTTRTCAYPIDNGRRVTAENQLAQSQTDAGYPDTSCRAYPEENSPFPSTAADPAGWNFEATTINNGNPTLIGPSPAFNKANICQRRLVDGVEVSSCECSYMIAKYGSLPKYLPADSGDVPVGYCTSGTYDGYECDPLASGTRDKNNLSCCSAVPAADSLASSLGGSISSGCDDGAQCVRLSKLDRVVGYEGQCLEHDFTTPINGRADEYACVTWRPVGLIGGSRDIYNQNQSAGYFAPADRRFYCVGNKPAWSVILNIDPSKDIKRQPISQFFGEGKFNRRVESFYSGPDNDCASAADTLGSTRWCLYPGVSVKQPLKEGDKPDKWKYMLTSNPLSMLGCYEVSDPNSKDAPATEFGLAEIVYPYIGPPVYRDQLKSIFFQVTDDIYAFYNGSPDNTVFYSGAGGADDQTDQNCESRNFFDHEGREIHGDGNHCSGTSCDTSQTTAFKIMIPEGGDDDEDCDVRTDLITTNPNQAVFTDCNDDGYDNIDSVADDTDDSKPYTAADIAAATVTPIATQGRLGIYYTNEENKWQVDASDNEGKIIFNPHFDSNGRLKEVVLMAEADANENGSGAFGINSMGFSFKAGCDQVARVDVPGEFGLTKAYTNAVNPVRNFTRSGDQFQDVFPYDFTAFTQACQVYGAVGAVSSNPPTKPWTYVAANPRYTMSTDANGVVTTTVVNNDLAFGDGSGVELPLQCTTLSSRTATRYQNSDFSEGIKKIFRAVTGFWKYLEIGNTGPLWIDKLPFFPFPTVVSRNDQVYPLAPSAGYNDTGSTTSASTGFNGGVKPPRVAAVDMSACTVNGRCGAGRTDSITLNGKQEGTLLGADGAMLVTAKFFAWASHNAMPILQRTMFWGDYAPTEPPAKGWYKNQKPFCSPDISDQNAVGECANNPGLTCAATTDCPGGAACVRNGNDFGNTPGACNVGTYQFDHSYTCSLKDLNATKLCTGTDVLADNAPCYRMINNSPVCVYRPKVQIVDNWDWCNCIGSGCDIPNVGTYGAECQLKDDANIKPWTEYAGEVRLTPTADDAKNFHPAGGSGGGSGGPPVSGGTARNDSGAGFTGNGNGLDTKLLGPSLLANDTITGTMAQHQVVLVTPPTHGNIIPITISGSGPGSGTFTITPDGYFNYKQNTNFHGNDTFTYKFINSGNSSNSATVTIHIP